VTSAGRFEYRVLGSLEISFDGVAFPVGGPRHRALLAALLVRPNTVVSADQLAETLWEQPRPRSTNLLYGRISEIRTAMRKAGGGPEAALETHPAGYLLRVEPDAVDAQRFERLVEEGLSAARAGRHAEAAGLQREALALWRGPALPELAHHPDAAAEIARLDELRMRALEARIDADLAAGSPGEVTAELVALVTEHPLNERLWAQLMLARYRSGRIGDALTTFETARGRLAEQLGVEPGEPLRRLHRQILRNDPVLTPAAPEPSRSRPPVRPLTSFIGRDPELATVRDLLRTERLITITGVGGAGKSRLAVEAAARAARDDAAVWLVELAALAQPDLLADAVGDVLGVPSHGTRPRADLIEDHLRGTDGLLVLDNCEHLIDAAAAFAHRILVACPGLRILATSRERLGVTGEVLLPLTGLALPDEPETAGQSAAVRLFAARARAADPAFALTAGTTAAVATICRELDGLPLAIELAAAHANAFTVAEMVARLDDRFTLLGQGSRATEPRHRTLHAVIDWSYRLLDDDERRVFARLSVFAGRFDLTWAEQLTEDPRQPALIAALVDKSLLLRESGRYRMLVTLRAYGIERLAEEGELASVRNRHATIMAGRADELGRHYQGERRGRTVRELGSMMDEFRAAMEWSVAGADGETAMRIAGALAIYWHITGQYAVGRRWLEHSLNSGGATSPAVRAWALSGLTALTSVTGDLPATTAAAEEAAELFERIGDRRGYGLVLRRLATAETMAGHLDRADKLLQEVIDAGRETAWPWLLGWGYTLLGMVRGLRRETAGLERLGADAEAALLDAGDPEILAYARLVRAEAARTLYGPAAGVGWLCDGLRALVRVEMPMSIALGLQFAILLLVDLGWSGPELMVRSAANELRRWTGGAPFPTHLQAQEQRLAHLRESLGEDEFAARWEAGRVRPVAEIVEEVCRELTDRVAPPESR
jgi:predicted ATPase/DNA-binding SARP family transcriptional activator